ncbi:MAG: TrkA family potassium uptake protein [bacterium]
MKSVAVIGLGNFGFWVAKTLFNLGHEVMGIDVNKDAVQRSQAILSQAIISDATKKETLIKLGLEHIDAAVVSTGDNVSACTLITLHLKEIGIKKIVVKAIDEDHGRILEKVGATDVIFPEKDMGIKIAKSLTTPNILDYLSMTEDYEIAELAPSKDFIGKSLVELDLSNRFRIQIIGVKELVPERFTLIPPANFIIKDSDVLVVLGKNSDIERIKE